MSCFKVSGFFDFDKIPPFVLGAFLSRTIVADNKIFTEASFKSSKFSKMNLSSYKGEYLKALNNISYPFFWELSETSDKTFKAKLILENDIGINKERFFYKLYYKIITDFDWLLADDFNENKKDFIRGFMEPRGSVDATACYIAQDYYYDDVFESKKYKILTDFCNVPYYVINLNFRDLQKQYYEKTVQRNTQFRINSKWYMKNIGMYNEYKADIFAKAHADSDKTVRKNEVSYFIIEEPKYNINNGVDDRFNFYLYNILDRSLSEEEIDNLRKNLGYTSLALIIRDSSLSEMIRKIEPDECVSCKNSYNILDRTFTHKKTGKPYFEIHHVISLANNKNLDDEKNMVKLCPICHGCLKRGVGIEKEQKEIIGRILLNSNKARLYTEKMLDCTDRKELIDKIYEKLK